MVEKFSERIKELREEKGLSQRQLAVEINVSQANISRWENGTQDPSTEWLVNLADYFNVSVDFLLGRED